MLAKSAFHHSVNYRSAVVMGVAAAVVDGDQKREALRAVTDHVAPGRWQEARQPTETELLQTSILSLPLDEASAKVREGPPGDDPEDADLEVWSGVVPSTSRPRSPATSGRGYATDGSARCARPAERLPSRRRVVSPDPGAGPAAAGRVLRGRLRLEPARRSRAPSFDDGSGHVVGRFTRDLPVAPYGGFRPYVYVAGVDETISAAVSAGGEVETAPYPGGDLTVAVLRDPAGNLVGVWQRD